MKARVSNTNQRANPSDRKAVFKSVLDNPFKVRWPYVSHTLQNDTLETLVTILDGVGAYNLNRQLVSRKRKSARHNKEKREKAVTRKKRKIGTEGEALADEDNDVDTTIHTKEAVGAVMEVDAEPDAQPDIEAPSVVAHLTMGINEVTKRLETQAQSRRLHASITASTSVETSPSASKPKPERTPLVYVFVCRADIDPQLLVGHLPELVAACNTPIPGCTSPPVHLISLPKNAENTLATAVGLRRVSVLALDSTTPFLAQLSSILTDVQPPSASWLTGPAPKGPAPKGPAPKPRTAFHIPTHIKQLRTSAPRDMRAAKQARIAERRAAKEKSKANFHINARNKDIEANRAGPSKEQRKVKAKIKAKVQPSKKRITAVSSTATTQDLSLT